MSTPSATSSDTAKPYAAGLWNFPASSRQFTLISITSPSMNGTALWPSKTSCWTVPRRTARQPSVPLQLSFLSLAGTIPPTSNHRLDVLYFCVPAEIGESHAIVTVRRRHSGREPKEGGNGNLKTWASPSKSCPKPNKEARCSVQSRTRSTWGTPYPIHLLTSPLICRLFSGVRSRSPI